MRKANLRGFFNDGEVVIQRVQPTGSANDSRLLHEETENTEEITVKISPIKPRAKAAATALKVLGKCSRVASSRRIGDAAPVDNSESSSSDEEKENKNEISTFMRRQRNELPAPARRAVRFTAAKASESIIQTVPSEPTLKQNIETKSTVGSRNFVMDNTMKNFDPANWKKVHADQKSSSSKFSLISSCHEVGKSVFELPEMLSPILNSGSISQDTSKDNSGDQDTCPLDISACETRKIDVDAVSSAQSLQQAADYLSCITFKNQSSAQCDINPSSSSRKSGRGYKDADRISTAEAGGDENCSKRRKRVSFAGNKGVNAVESLQQCKSRPAATEESEAVTLYLKGVRYTRLNVLGKGGSSCVYRVLSSCDSQLYAYKRVEVKGSSEDNEAVFDSYINEIELLKRLKGSSPYIIDLVDAEVNREEMYIAIVMEAGEVDLAKVLSQKQKMSNQNLPWHVPVQPQAAAVRDNAQGQTSLSSSSSSSSSSSEGREPLSPFFVRMVWQEMLEAVDHIHRNRIVHGDLKPANFVFVKGHLKLIDFGIAKAISNDTTNIYRESQIGTVNYMAPEAIAPYTTDPGSNLESGHDEHEGMSMRLGRASDIWSLGCILYQMLFGRPPFAALTTIQKLHAIPNAKYAIQYPTQGKAADWDAVETIKACLERDPGRRATIRGEGGLLSMPYLSVESLRCTGRSEKEKEKENKGIVHDAAKVTVTKDMVRLAVQSATSRNSRSRSGSLHSSEEEEELYEEVWVQLCQQGEQGTEREVELPMEGTGAGRRVLAGIPTGVPTPAVSVVVPGPRSVNEPSEGVTHSRSRTAGESSSLSASTSAVSETPPSPSDAAQRMNNKENNPQATAGSSATTSITTSKSTERLLSSQAARIALLAATAMTAKRKASVALTDHDQNQNELHRLRTVRQPLRTLQTQSQSPSSYTLNQIPVRVSSEDIKEIRKPESRDQSPDKQDPRSALEKRIGAMRKFLDEEQPADLTGTGTFDFADGGSFF